MKKYILLITIALLLAACAPSPQTIQTSIAQTQAAIPTLTFTPIPPTETPTNTPTLTPSETPTITTTSTPDLIALQQNLIDFLLQISDFPPQSNYSLVSAGSENPNALDDSAEVEDTGRIVGWSDWYGKEPIGKGWNYAISDAVVLYRTTAGAQLAITKYNEFGMGDYSKEEINPPEIGDITRAFFVSVGFFDIYVIYFSYRNIVHEVVGSNEDPEFVRNIARLLLARLKASPLLNP